MELGHPPSGCLWSLLVLTEPAPQADGFPAALEVRLQDEPCAQQGEEQHGAADHTCRGGTAASESCSLGQALDHPSGFLGSDPCVPRLPAQGDRHCLACVVWEGS